MMQEKMREAIEGKSYTFAYHCDNCGNSGSRGWPFGQERPEHVECSKCGCQARTTHKERIVPDLDMYRL